MANGWLTIGLAVHDDDPLATGDTNRAGASGLTTDRLRGAIHDLRGPLNTLSILHEILRGATGNPTAQREAIEGARRALQQCDGMLRRLRGVSDAMAPRLTAMPLPAELAAAVARAPRDNLPVQLAADAGQQLVVSSCPERLPRMLDLLLACARGALPGGGTLGLAARRDGDRAVVEVTAAGPTIVLPAAGSVARLTPDDPGPADWFALACLTAGIGGELVLAAAAGHGSLTVRLPLPPSPTGSNPPC